MTIGWSSHALQFFRDVEDSSSGGARSTQMGPVTLYGTCYCLLGKMFLGADEQLSPRTRRFILECQDPISGLMLGPELREFSPSPQATHDRAHLLLHLTCTALPVCQHFALDVKYPLRAAHSFADLAYLKEWLSRRDLRRAWLEGNNLLFVGQLLVYLRDVEGLSSSASALQLWFEWLDNHVDPSTSLWGSDGRCSAMEAVYGGYHQLLVYYHEGHAVANAKGLVDTVLALQHPDGGFYPAGNGGACEDVDCVDILSNMYKQSDYRRAEIRVALRRCMRHILALQNSDGGFPYNRDSWQSHMGIPGTEAPPNCSTTFATWFRVHTLALMAEILTDEPCLRRPFHFTNSLSMGWHQPWDKRRHGLTQADRRAERPFDRQWTWRRARFEMTQGYSRSRIVAHRMRLFARRLYEKLGAPDDAR
jgi:hypothetical protein